VLVPAVDHVVDEDLEVRKRLRDPADQWRCPSAALDQDAAWTPAARGYEDLDQRLAYRLDVGQRAALSGVDLFQPGRKVRDNLGEVSVLHLHGEVVGGYCARNARCRE
jgi:hypothetical protein